MDNSHKKNEFSMSFLPLNVCWYLVGKGRQPLTINYSCATNVRRGPKLPARWAKYEFFFFFNLYFYFDNVNNQFNDWTVPIIERIIQTTSLNKNKRNSAVLFTTLNHWDSAPFFYKQFSIMWNWLANYREEGSSWRTTNIIRLAEILN